MMMNQKVNKVERRESLLTLDSQRREVVSPSRYLITHSSSNVASMQIMGSHNPISLNRR
jgi:hypothetical protein